MTRAEAKRQSGGAWGSWPASTGSLDGPVERFRTNKHAGVKQCS
jgi:hypothetical protein